MRKLEGELTSWLDRAANRPSEVPDVDEASEQSPQQSSQQNDVWKTWDVAKQLSLDPGDLSSQPFDEIYLWLQKNTEFEEFVSWSSSGPRGRILFLDADLGTGRTDLLRMVCMKLSESQKDETTSSLNSRNVVLFVPDSNRPNRNNAAFLLRSLVFCIMEQQPSLDFPDTEKKHFQGPADFYALKMILYALLRNEKFRPTYFVICDSMEPSAIDSINSVTTPTFEQHKTPRSSSDEWGFKDLMSLIVTTVADSDSIRWLVSFNRNQELASGFDMNDSLKRVTITTNEDNVQEILACYSVSRLSEIARTQSRDNSTSKEIYESMRKFPHHDLLWINTALDMTKRDPAYWNAPTIFQGLIKDAPDMRSLYQKAKEEINKLRETDKWYCFRILSTLAFAYRPLSSAELQDIANLPAEISVTVLIEEFLPLFLYNDHCIRLWDTAPGALQHVLGDVGSFVYSVVISRSGPRGQPLVAACGSSTVKLWNLSTGLMMKELDSIEQVEESESVRGGKTEKAVTFEDDGDSTCSNGDADEGTAEASEARDDSSTQARSNFLVERIDISPEGDYLVALVNHCLVLWKTSDFDKFTLHNMDENQALNSVRFSPDGQHLAAGIDSHILTCDLPTKKQWESREPTEIHWLPAPPTHDSGSSEAIGEELENDTEQEDGANSDPKGFKTASTQSTKLPKSYYSFL
ncbi:heterokaryon incompatibility protein R [Fusarium bulbicola]|nr:heterokaryon incompatibility protein R [Fusarium bulbicola]